MPLALEFYGLLSDMVLNIDAKDYKLSTGSSNLTLTDSDITEGLKYLYFSRQTFSNCDMTFVFSKISSICGNKVVQGKQQCDNGNFTGCLNCTANKGYKCSKNEVDFSICSTICGDGLKYGSEECDNGKLAGCSDCKVEERYTCTGDIGQ